VKISKKFSIIYNPKIELEVGNKKLGINKKPIGTTQVYSISARA